MFRIGTFSAGAAAEQPSLLPCFGKKDEKFPLHCF
nr:MAG TPA: hypothetical protein [Caudoviricetes sp.]